MTGPILRDRLIGMAALVVDDVERTMIANDNRLRVLTTPADKLDTDGVARGFGLSLEHPDVKRLAELVDTLGVLNKMATRNLEKVVHQHPLWERHGARHLGVGEKTLGRLLAAIGDPYWNDLHDRPRKVSELWAFSGLDTRDGHARRLQRGVKANWSGEAKKRVWLIATGVMKARDPHYRGIYDARRLVTAERVHGQPCIRCGPAGKPAAAGTSWSKAHQLADALRVVSKEILRDLWRVSRDYHLELEDQTTE